MIVYVVMSNDFPDSVFSTQALAEDYVDQKEAAEIAAEGKGGLRRRIYWRVYEFRLDKESAA